jgi:carbon-monoxide dehydrogenase iron sulfur subunit
VEAIKQGARPRIFIEAAGAFAVPLQCRHCEDAPCARVCPSGALSRPSEAEPVLIDQEKCIGCGFCVQACPFGVIRLAPSPGSDAKAVIKCDLCFGRQAQGLQPACVEACPVRALKFVEVEENARQARRTAASDLATTSLQVVRPKG